MRRWPTLVLLALLLGALAPSALSDDPDPRLLVPAVARLAGAHGTLWRSTLVVHNPGPTPITVELELLERGRASSFPATATLTIPAHGSSLTEDVLATLFGVVSGAGALLLEADGPIVASSRTYTSVASPGDAHATWGQHVPALPIAPIAATRQYLLIQLTATDAFRTNLGLVNLGYDELLAWTVPIVFAGEAPKARMLTAPAHGMAQYDGLLAETGAQVPDGMFWIDTDFLSGPFLAWASVVDNGTGDAMFVPPVLPASQPVYLLGAAHAGGAGGTRWRTDLQVVGDPQLPVDYRVEWLPRNRDNREPLATEHQLAPGEAHRHADVVAGVFGATGAGALRVTPTRGQPLVSARTFNHTPLGSYGQYIPALSLSDAAAPGNTAVVVHLRETASFRTNLGLLNASEVEITVEIELLDAAGASLGGLAVDLPPYAFHQLERVLRRVTLDPVELAAAHLATTTPGGAFLAYASVVDTASGDPILVPATRMTPHRATAVSPERGF